MSKADALKRHHITDIAFSSKLFEFLEGKSVLSMGEGMDAYKNLLVLSHRKFNYSGCDGNPFTEAFSNGSVWFCETSFTRLGLDVEFRSGRAYTREIRTRVSQ